MIARLSVFTHFHQMLNRLRTNPLWHLFCHNRLKNSFLTLFTLLFNLFAASLEGASFIFILGSFNVLNDNPPRLLESFQYLDKTRLFSLLMLGAVFAQILRSLSAYVGQLLTAKLTINLQSDAQNLIYRQIFGLSFSSVNRYKSGDLMHYATAPPTYFRNLIDWTNRGLVSLLMIVAYLVFMVSLSLPLTLFALVLFAFSALLQKTLIQKITDASKSQTEHLVNLNQETAQNLAGLRTVHLFERRDHLFAKITNTLKRISSSSLRLNRWIHLIMPLNEIIAVVLVGSTMIMGLYFLRSAEGDLFASLLTFLALTYRLGMRLQVLMSSCGEVASNIGPIYRLREFLPASDQHRSESKAGDRITSIERIEFDHVSFRYPGKEGYALRAISLEIERGKTVAFVGSSGGGKSTLLDLLLRLYTPESGEITVDGKALADYSLSSWRALFGVVSQDVFLFHESIDSNIRFGKLEATHEEVVQAAKLAGADRFIRKLPEGYQTVVGERGHKLSGGEKQRISLARALVRNPRILVLDEATSNLDSHSERLIQDAIEELKGKVTVLVVAHRLATVNMADQILLLEDGRIVERGTHDDLIHLGGRYHHFWSLQSTLGKRAELV